MRRLKLISRPLGKRLGIWKPAGSNLTILPDDVFLVSYPKSGNTWMRFLLGQAISGKVLDFATIEKVVPDIYQNSNAELLAIARPRILKSHESFTSSYHRVIYLVRDPRDVAISFYFWRRKTGGFKKFGKTPSLAEYLRDGFADQEMFMQGWGSHARSWIQGLGASADSFLVVKYEEIEHSPIDILQKTTEFINCGIQPDQLDFAVRFSHASEMRKAESTQLDRYLPGFFLKLLGKEKIPFVRRGHSGEWRIVFSSELNEIYWDRFGDWMEYLGYSKFK